MGSKVHLELYWLYLWLTEEIGKRSKQKTLSRSIGRAMGLQHRADTGLCPGLEAEEIGTNF